MLKVSQEVHVYEEDGKELDVASGLDLLVMSHPVWNTLVVLKIGGHSWALSAHDLQAAIVNATNTG